MRITNKKYEILKSAKEIISTLRDKYTSDYWLYLNELIADVAFKAKLDKLHNLEFELRELLETIDVVG